MPLRISLDSGVKVPEHHDAVEASDAAEYAAILAQPPDKLSLEQLSKGDGVTFSDGQMSIHFGNLLGIGDLEESNELPDGAEIGVCPNILNIQPLIKDANDPCGRNVEDDDPMGVDDCDVHALQTKVIDWQLAYAAYWRWTYDANGMAIARDEANDPPLYNFCGYIVNDGQPFKTFWRPSEKEPPLNPDEWSVLNEPLGTALLMMYKAATAACAKITNGEALTPGDAFLIKHVHTPVTESTFPPEELHYFLPAWPILIQYLVLRDKAGINQMFNPDTQQFKFKDAIQFALNKVILMSYEQSSDFNKQQVDLIQSLFDNYKHYGYVDMLEYQALALEDMRNKVFKRSNKHPIPTDVKVVTPLLWTSFYAFGSNFWETEMERAVSDFALTQLRVGSEFEFQILKTATQLFQPLFANETGEFQTLPGELDASPFRRLLGKTVAIYMLQLEWVRRQWSKNSEEAFNVNAGDDDNAGSTNMITALENMRKNSFDANSGNRVDKLNQIFAIQAAEVRDNMKRDALFSNLFEDCEDREPFGMRVCSNHDQAFGFRIDSRIDDVYKMWLADLRHAKRQGVRFANGMFDVTLSKAGINIDTLPPSIRDPNDQKKVIWAKTAGTPEEWKNLQSTLYRYAEYRINECLKIDVYPGEIPDEVKEVLVEYIDEPNNKRSTPKYRSRPDYNAKGLNTGTDLGGFSEGLAFVGIDVAPDLAVEEELQYRTFKRFRDKLIPDLKQKDTFAQQKCGIAGIECLHVRLTNLAEAIPTTLKKDGTVKAKDRSKFENKLNEVCNLFPILESLSVQALNSYNVMLIVEKYRPYMAQFRKWCESLKQSPQLPFSTLDEWNTLRSTVEKFCLLNDDNLKRWQNETAHWRDELNNHKDLFADVNLAKLSGGPIFKETSLLFAEKVDYLEHRILRYLTTVEWVGNTDVDQLAAYKHVTSPDEPPKHPVGTGVVLRSKTLEEVTDSFGRAIEQLEFVLRMKNPLIGFVIHTIQNCEDCAEALFILTWQKFKASKEASGAEKNNAQINAEREAIKEAFYERPSPSDKATTRSGRRKELKMNKEALNKDKDYDQYDPHPRRIYQILDPNRLPPSETSRWSEFFALVSGSIDSVDSLRKEFEDVLFAMKQIGSVARHGGFRKAYDGDNTQEEKRDDKDTPAIRMWRPFDPMKPTDGDFPKKPLDGEVPRYFVGLLDPKKPDDRAWADKIMGDDISPPKWNFRDDGDFLEECEPYNHQGMFGATHSIMKDFVRIFRYFLRMYSEDNDDPVGNGNFMYRIFQKLGGDSDGTLAPLTYAQMSAFDVARLGPLVAFEETTSGIPDDTIAQLEVYANNQPLSRFEQALKAALIANPSYFNTFHEGGISMRESVQDPETRWKQGNTPVDKRPTIPNKTLYPNGEVDMRTVLAQLFAKEKMAGILNSWRIRLTPADREAISLDAIIDNVADESVFGRRNTPDRIDTITAVKLPEAAATFEALYNVANGDQTSSLLQQYKYSRALAQLDNYLTVNVADRQKLAAKFIAKNVTEQIQRIRDQGDGLNRNTILESVSRAIKSFKKQTISPQLYSRASNDVGYFQNGIYYDLGQKFRREIHDRIKSMLTSGAKQNFVNIVKKLVEAVAEYARKNPYSQDAIKVSGDDNIDKYFKELSFNNQFDEAMRKKFDIYIKLLYVLDLDHVTENRKNKESSRNFRKTEASAILTPQAPSNPPPERGGGGSGGGTKRKSADAEVANAQLDARKQWFTSKAIQHRNGMGPADTDKKRRVRDAVVELAHNVRLLLVGFESQSQPNDTSKQREAKKHLKEKFPGILEAMERTPRSVRDTKISASLQKFAVTAVDIFLKITRLQVNVYKIVVLGKPGNVLNSTNLAKYGRALVQLQEQLNLDPSDQNPFQWWTIDFYKMYLTPKTYRYFVQLREAVVLCLSRLEEEFKINEDARAAIDPTDPLAKPLPREFDDERLILNPGKPAVSLARLRSQVTEMNRIAFEVRERACKFILRMANIYNLGSMEPSIVLLELDDFALTNAMPEHRECANGRICLDPVLTLFEDFRDDMERVAQWQQRWYYAYPHLDILKQWEYHKVWFRQDMEEAGVPNVLLTTPLILEESNDIRFATTSPLWNWKLLRDGFQQSALLYPTKQIYKDVYNAMSKLAGRDPVKEEFRPFVRVLDFERFESYRLFFEAVCFGMIRLSIEDMQPYIYDRNIEFEGTVGRSGQHKQDGSPKEDDVKVSLFEAVEMIRRMGYKYPNLYTDRLNNRVLLTPDDKDDYLGEDEKPNDDDEVDPETIQKIVSEPSYFGIKRQEVKDAEAKDEWLQRKDDWVRSEEEKLEMSHPRGLYKQSGRRLALEEINADKVDDAPSSGDEDDDDDDDDDDIDDAALFGDGDDDGYAEDDNEDAGGGGKRQKPESNSFVPADRERQEQERQRQRQQREQEQREQEQREREQAPSPGQQAGFFGDFNTKLLTHDPNDASCGTLGTGIDIVESADDGDCLYHSVVIAMITYEMTTSNLENQPTHWKWYWDQVNSAAKSLREQACEWLSISASRSLGEIDWVSDPALHTEYEAGRNLFYGPDGTEDVIEPKELIEGTKFMRAFSNDTGALYNESYIRYNELREASGYDDILWPALHTSAEVEAAIQSRVLDKFDTTFRVMLEKAIKAYINQAKQPKSYAEQLEVIAVSAVLQRPICVFKIVEAYSPLSNLRGYPILDNLYSDKFPILLFYGHEQIPNSKLLHYRPLIHRGAMYRANIIAEKTKP